MKMVEVLKEKEKKPFCENCNSFFGYVKNKTNEFVCRTCGHITKINKEQSKLKEDWKEIIDKTKKVKKDGNC